ncbi:LysM domain/ErfK/YbiS/YcfS/YnhG family protein [Klebsiella pneumoniae]|uniref:LysM domain/ErfK/YbiS/YcfS/YnhG family protein n=1 Tax=Klebsiella pneumoniae TaxID=573 RepID=A0A378F744_KLEPN|nr:LysM domain/ErfK/YbiS/YcfS/YnhG family protein [Klebsiella pneumoniae]
MAAVWLRSISRCLSISDDDPQTLPITLNAAMTAFKQAPQTDGTVMERAMNYRSGMPIDVTRHAEPGPQSL